MSDLGKLLIETAGDSDEYTTIREYIQNSENSPVEGVTAAGYWNNALAGSYRDILVSFGRLIRQYEQQNQLEPRDLNNSEFWEIQHIVDYGRSLVGVYREPPEFTDDGETLTDFTYTIGNYLQHTKAPEILSFWPYAQTTSMLLNRLSECLINESVKPFLPGETRKIYGFLGLCGEMPIVMRLLNNSERKESYEKWTCQLPETVDVLLLVIPDTMGYFPWEESCSEDIRDLFPRSIKMAEYQSSTAEIRPTEDSLPSLPGEFIMGVIYFSYLFQGDELGESESAATIKFLREIRLYLEFELADDFETDFLDYGDLRYYEWNSFCTFSVPSSAASWIREQLDEFDDDVLAQDFGIGNQPSCDYLNKEAFIADIDFMRIRHLLAEVYRESVSSDQPEETLFFLKMVNDKSEGDLPPIYKHIPRYQVDAG